MKEIIKIASASVEITWLEDHGDSHCGWARILDDQAPPEDGDVFRVGGSTYHIGRWQRQGDDLVARVYAK